MNTQRETPTKYYLKHILTNSKNTLFHTITHQNVVRKHTFIFSLLFFLFTNINAQTIFDNENITFGTSGYLRTGWGQSEGGTQQAHFQMPGAQNKYSLGNQADTYGELEFDLSFLLNKEDNKSIDVIWMTSYYKDFGQNSVGSYNTTEQLYAKLNNLLGNNEIIWAGKRFYHRRAIHLMDRQWFNPNQTGWGAGIENLIDDGTDKDFKIGAWYFLNQDVYSYKNNEKKHLLNYTAEARYCNVPISENSKITTALSYTYRAANDKLDYDAVNGFGITSALNTEVGNNITNELGVVFRQGSAVVQHHWTGSSEYENPNNNNTVMNDLNKAWYLELNNNFLYDDKEKYAINGILSCVIRDYGTNPYTYNQADGSKTFLDGRGSKFLWLTAGARGYRYLNDYFKLSLEYTHEYANNKQLDLKGHLQKICFTPELSLKKGFYSRPVLRPFVTYAWWSDELKGNIGTYPTGAPFADKTNGFTYGLQFEIWW